MDEGERVTSSILADRLGIFSPAVTDMAKKLALRGLLLLYRISSLN